MSTFDLENPKPKAGDALRDEAANLLAVRYGRPQSEKLTVGKKVDLFFTRSDFGKETRIYVEAKDYAEPLERRHVVQIWADYSGIIANKQPASLLIITRAGLAPGALAFVAEEQKDLRHQTIWELENETLGITPYVRSLAELFDDNGLSAYYIEGQARSATYSESGGRSHAGKLEPLFDVISRWITSEDGRPFAVLGGYGAGKSSLAKRLVAAQAKAALSDPHARRPVLIRLGMLARYSSLEGLLAAQFTHEYPIDGFNLRHFLDMNTKGRLLIVLDGFDEMKHAMTWSDFRSQIADLNRLTGGKAKVVLLGRPSAFTSADEHAHVLRGIRRWESGWRRLPDWPEFIEYDLEPFSPTERASFVARYLRHLASGSQPGSDAHDESWIAERAGDVNRLADSDPEVFSKPVHAKILTDLAADPHVDISSLAASVSRWGLYDLFFTSLAEREAEKQARRPIGEDTRLSFLRELAFWLWTEVGGATAFRAADVPDRLIVDAGLSEAPDLEAAKREYLTGAALEKKSGDLYHFGHRSFAEFLVAQRMVLRPPSPADQSRYSSLTKDGVLAFLREAPESTNFAAWTDTLSNAQGTVHLEYFAHLADRLGGKAGLVRALPSTSIWIPVLDALGDEVAMSEASLPGLVAAMRTEHNILFFLLLRLFQHTAAMKGLSQQNAAKTISAVLLDRVFARAAIDRESRKVVVSEDGDDARMLAQCALPIVRRDRLGNYIAHFRGAQLARLSAERLRKAGVDLGLHPPAPTVPLIEDGYLNWDDVLARMPADTQQKARDYFRRAEDWGGVFTSATKAKGRVPR